MTRAEDPLSKLLPSFSRYMAANRAYSQRLGEASSVAELAEALADFTDEGAICMLTGFGFLIDDQQLLDDWMIDAMLLRKELDEAAIWRNTHKGMLVVGHIYPRVWVHCGIRPPSQDMPSEFHLSNTAHFARLFQRSSQGEHESLEGLIGNLRWLAIRGADLARRAVVALYSVHRPSELPTILAGLGPSSHARS